MKTKLFVLLAFLLPLSQAFAAWNDRLITPSSMESRSLSEIAAQVSAGQVILMGESHDFLPDHVNQARFLESLPSKLAVSVGMEFFDYTKQDTVDQYLSGRLSESEFLKLAGWGKNDYSQYRAQVLFPASHGGSTLALNLPRKISSRISQVGVSRLSAEEAAFLPPNFTLGRSSYRTRFAENIKQNHGEVPEEIVQNFFEAQSSWDDTMAWKISEFMKANPDQVLFVIVGRFHVEHGGGLPDRLRARGVTKLLTITQHDAREETEAELQDALTPHAEYGPVSDLVWIQGEPK